ncbi:MAG: kinesin, partial [Rhizobiaceae bacterium]
MARKTSTLQNIDSDVARELEEALNIDLNPGGSDGDLDIAASMAELEAQISRAADELAREEKAQKEAAATKSKKEESLLETRPAEAARPVQAAANAAPKAIAQPSPKEEPRAKVAAELRPSKPAPALQPQASRSQASQPQAERTASPAARLPANDDQQKDYRTVLAQMNRSAPGTVYWFVALLSVAWIAGGLMLGHLLYAPKIWQIRSVGQLLDAPYAIALGIGIIVPIVLFWGFAVMIRRAQEMRMVARSMTEVAFRLAEPEHLAQDRVTTVGQAVRREVQAMGEGIERTLARAVELETLVHTEVNELERAYSDNETRIRALVDGLGNERDAVVSHAERVRASIAGAHEQLHSELGVASQGIRDNILGASSRLTATISEAGDRLIDRINDSSTTINEG